MKNSKKWLAAALAMLMMTGCSSADQQVEETPVQDTVAGDETMTEDQQTDTEQTENNDERSRADKTLVVSYSWPVLGMEDTDTNTSASVVVNDGEIEGNTAWAASLIADELGAQWIALEAQDDYPLEYDPLIEQAQEEKNAAYRPALKEIPDLDTINTVILVTPNWWSDMPMPVYTFLDAENWEGKTIVPVVIHGGSGFSGIIDTLSGYGSVDEADALSISRSNLMSSEDTIRQWAKSL